MFKTIVKPGVAVSMVCAAIAQPNKQEPVTIVATGVGESAEVSAAIPVDERRPIVAKAWQHLGKLVQRKSDGSAKALHRDGTAEQWVQWKNLRIVSVRDAGVSNSDLMNGVTRRYYCVIASEAHRVWNPESISWTEWKRGSYEPFPWRVEVSWESGEWIARVDHDGQFIAPGGGRSRSGKAGIYRVTSSGHESRVAMRF
jgi:hypothetical protein